MYSLACNPVALGDRWVAFASNTEPTQKDLSRSGFRGEPSDPGLSSAPVHAACCVSRLQWTSWRPALWTARRR